MLAGGSLLWWLGHCEVDQVHWALLQEEVCEDGSSHQHAAADDRDLRQYRHDQTREPPYNLLAATARMTAHQIKCKIRLPSGRHQAIDFACLVQVAHLHL